MALCETTLTPQGYRAVDIDCRLGGRSMLRIFIERLVDPAAEPGDPPKTSIEDCTRVSRLIGIALDAENLIEGTYDLEVSSPGLDRRLRIRTDFEKVVGGEIKLKLTENWQGRGAHLTGKLARVDGGGIILAMQGQEVPIPLPKIKQANLVWQFK